MAAAMLAVVAIPVRAARILPTTIVSNGSPILIDACLVEAIDLGSIHNLGLAINFTNQGSLPATAIRFSFELIDAFDKPAATFSGDRIGNFAPGQTIHARNNFAGPKNEGVIKDPAPQALRAVCSVKYVKFEDGKIWNQGQMEPSTLTYPSPTPSIR
jgi:hypothetical protein